jgi:hypothetical protein
MGLDVQILTNGQVIQDLPNGTGIEMDFPRNGSSSAPYAVLHWNDPDGDGQGEWLEITQLLNRNQLNQTLSTSAPDELYQLTTALGDGFFPVLTTQKTGIFVLVQK